MGPHGGSWNVAAAALILLAVLLAYAPALRAEFVWDDRNNLVDAAWLRSWRGAAEAFRRPAMWSAGLPQGAVGTYRPLALASFVVDHQLLGPAAAGFHLSSVLWHGLAQVAVYALLRLLGTSRSAALGLALLSALHPTSVEAVAWINGRSEVLALLFGALALCCAATPRRSTALAAGPLLLLSMLGKETGAIFVLLAPWLAGIVEERRGAHRRNVALCAAGALLGYAALRLFALAGGALPPMGSLGSAVRALPALWLRAAQEAAMPLDRAPTTVQLWLRELSSVEYAAYATAATALILILCWLLASRRAIEAFGLSWWLLGLLPATLITVYPWPGLHRWLYIGLPGLLLCLHRALGPRLTPSRARALLGALLAAAVALTERALPTWRDDGSLFATMIEESPRDPFGYQSLGAVLVRQGRCDGAVELLERALALGASDDGVHALLAVCQARLGRCDEAAARSAAHPSPMVPEAALLREVHACRARARPAGPVAP